MERFGPDVGSRSRCHVLVPGLGLWSSSESRGHVGRRFVRLAVGRGACFTQTFPVACSHGWLNLRSIQIKETS